MREGGSWCSLAVQHPSVSPASFGWVWLWLESRSGSPQEKSVLHFHTVGCSPSYEVHTHCAGHTMYIHIRRTYVFLLTLCCRTLSSSSSFSSSSLSAAFCVLHLLQPLYLQILVGPVPGVTHCSFPGLFCVCCLFLWLHGWGMLHECRTACHFPSQRS